MSLGYLDLDLELDMAALIDTALANFAARFPGWQPTEAHLEVALVEELARLVHEGSVVASRVPRAIFRYFGRSLLGLPPVDAAPATATSTWTFVDDAGYTIPAGTAVAYPTAGDVYVPFVTDAEYEREPGSAVLAGVGLLALEDGVQHNGYADATVLTLLDPLASVASGGVVTSSVSTGGADAETDDEYLDRLVEELALLSPTPILAPDFAIMARRVPGVHRAMVVDNYDLTDDSDDNERMVTLWVVAEDGSLVGAPTKTAVAALLEGLREVNFVVHVGDPTFTAVAVAFTVTLLAGYAAIDVITRCEQAVLDYLHAGAWGGGAESPPEWRDQTTVYVNEIVALLDRQAGVDRVVAVTLNGGGNLVLAGRAPLPGPVTAVGIVA